MRVQPSKPSSTTGMSSPPFPVAPGAKRTKVMDAAPTAVPSAPTPSVADRIRRLSEPLNPVLDYWFFSDEQARLQHRLWFCGDGSAQQAAADAEIVEKFGVEFDAAASGRWQPDEGCAFALLTHVVLLDQLGRHVYRHRGADAAARKRATDPLALRSAEHLLSLRAAWTYLTAPQLVFALMPLRHSKEGTPADERARHERALAYLERIESERHAEDGRVLARFRAATVRRHQALCDVRPAADGILEREEFTPAAEVLAAKPREPLVRSVARFLLGQGEAFAAGGVACVSLSGGVDSMVVADVLCHLRDHPRPVERARKGQFKSTSDRRVRHNVLESGTAGLVKQVTCVHINYGNRDAANDEAEFLKGWCERRGIRLVVRAMADDLRRAGGATSRDEYEVATRAARFDEYRREMSEGGAAGVCLGHHRGDIVENVLSNASRGSGVMELSGMQEVSSVDGVVTWRPLLLHDKAEVLAYAHAYGVPYFLDTTPSWSTRGKLRGKLMPCLQDTYGQGAERNLHALALDSDAVRRVVHERLVAPFLEARVRTRAFGVEVRFEGYTAHGRLFWREVLKEIQHGVFNTSMLGDAALRELGSRLSLTNFEPNDAAYAQAPQEGWIEPKHGLHWYLQGDTLYIPHPRIFAAPFAPPADAAEVPVDADAAPFPAGALWTVSAVPFVPTEEQAGDKRRADHRALPLPCRRPPFEGWSALLEGAFTYYVAVPVGTQKLAFLSKGVVPSPKATEGVVAAAQPPLALPHCWKQMHVRFQQTLPVLCGPRITNYADVSVVEVRCAAVAPASLRE